jgi:Fe(3+) dicitrate transport protein
MSFNLGESHMSVRAFVLRVPLVLLPLLAVPPAAPAAAAPAAPSPAANVVTGVVVDSTGVPVADALVTLRREADAFVSTSRTDPGGRFRVDGPAGSFELAVSAPGFSVSRAPIQLPTASELRLALAPGTFAEELTVVASRLAGSAEAVGRLPGSVDVLDRRQLQVSRVLTVGESLRKAAGLHVRDEEGFSLRPNIGIRGLNPTRSTKTLLLEDGLFVTYAPYGDNASYYHPPIERFEMIEVVKGSGQIAYGPVTVGGVVNYVTPAPPARPSLGVRVAGGNRGYRNGQLLAGGTWSRLALLAEYMRKEGDGARENVGTQLDDATVKAVLTLDPKQTLTLKANYYGEDSQVTYSGLRQSEWDENPRGNPFVNDGFDGSRLGGSLRHAWLLRPQTLLTTQLYASRFSRDWWRQSSNSAQRPNDAADPLCGGMENLLTTCGNEGRLRDYDHAGLEPRLRTALTLGDVSSELELGVRAHVEVQERRQVNGDTPTAREGRTVEDNRRENQAYSAFLLDRVLLGDFTLSGGARFEQIRYERTNRLANDGAGASGTTSLGQWVPGIGLAWSRGDALTLFGGAHRGFAPPRTEDVISQTGGVVDLDPELSWNYELGVRSVPLSGLRLDATAFRNDYENQVVPASLAGGVGATLTNGGETLHQGAELAVRVDTGTLRGSRHNVFARGAFTWLPVARFEGDRTSSVPGSSGVSVSGNRLPYAPETLLTAAVGYEHPRGLAAQLEVVYVGEQTTDDLGTIAGTPDGQRGLIAASTVWNLALSYELRQVTFFVTAKNLLDELYVVDRSRGLLPGAPRLVQLGIATRF